MTIRLSFKDVEDLLKNSNPLIKGMDPSFHWNPDNIDFNKDLPHMYDIILEVRLPISSI